MIGIGTYDLSSSADRAFAFDFDSSGKLDHLALYRPGSRIFWILKNTRGTFTPVVASFSGIGGYDLSSNGGTDSVFAFDYDGSGKLDHLVLYRPGTGTFWILKNNKGNFTPVVANSGQGIGGYDLRSPADRAFAFDYNGSGRTDHVVLYRPGSGAVFIVQNNSGNFVNVYAQGQGGSGIGGYDFSSNGGTDSAFAFDYDGSGKLDHLVLYRPGTGIFWILKNTRGTFTPVVASFSGIGGYDLRSPSDRAFAFDYDGRGKLDHVVLFRPGSGAVFIVKNSGGNFVHVYSQGAGGAGIGGYDFSSNGGTDSAFAFDYDGSRRLDHLVLYRPGAGIVWILKNIAGSFQAVYAAGPPASVSHSGFWGSVSSGFETIGNGIVSAGQTAVGAVGGGLTSVLASAGGALTQTGQVVGSGFNAAGNSVSAAAASGWNAAQSVESAGLAVSNECLVGVTTVQNGIKNGADTVWQGAVAAAQYVSQYACDIALGSALSGVFTAMAADGEEEGSTGSLAFLAATQFAEKAALNTAARALAFLLAGPVSAIPGVSNVPGGKPEIENIITFLIVKACTSNPAMVVGSAGQFLAGAMIYGITSVVCEGKIPGGYNVWKGAQPA
jgi:hypothetical protein